MTTLAEIEKAVEALPADQQRELVQRVNRNLTRRKIDSLSGKSWPVPPPDVPIEELKPIHAIIEEEFSKIDPLDSNASGH